MTTHIDDYPLLFRRLVKEEIVWTYAKKNLLERIILPYEVQINHLHYTQFPWFTDDADAQEAALYTTSQDGTRHLIWGEGFEEGRYYDGISWPKDELSEKLGWDNFQYNPPQIPRWAQSEYPSFPWSLPDPNADPKPTWAEVLIESWKLNLTFLSLTALYGVEEFLASPGSREPDTRRSLQDLILEHGGQRYYVGDGINHMGALIHKVAEANEAGNHMAPVTLGLGGGGTKKIYTQSEMRDVLIALSYRENEFESSHNEVVGEIRRLHWIFKDETKPAKERCLAIMEARYLVDQYEMDLKKALDAYDPNALPDDIATLKEIYKERLEAVATRKLADIKNASTQHGIDLPESCLDQAKATQKVSNKKQKGQIEIQRASTATELKDLFDTWKFRIESVKVENVPKWSHKGGNTYEENDGTSAIELSGRQWEFAAVTPDPKILGKIAAESAEAWAPDGTIFDRISASLDNNKIRVLVDNDVAADTQINVRLGARNICGPSYLYLKLTVTALPGE